MSNLPTANEISEPDLRTDLVSTPETTQRVSFHTLGCKLNQAETSALAQQFRHRGYEIVPFREEADLSIINTCTVTNEADAKCRQVIRQAAAASPGGRVAVMGCYSQIKPDEVASLGGVHIVMGNHRKHGIFDLLDQLSHGDDDFIQEVMDLDDVDVFGNIPEIAATHRTRAYLKVQEGCDYNCSFCIIPTARGIGRSRSMESCLIEARELVKLGYLEIVLTGVNIGTWTDGGKILYDLVDNLSRIDGLARLRISSIEPNLLTDELIDLVAARDNLCPHFHIPMQHASNNILKAMRRRYHFEDYVNLLDRIITRIPDAAIGADVIVGFPGETEADFAILANALNDLPLSYHHIFRYSAREGTVAAVMANPVHPSEMKRRSAVLRRISRDKHEAYGRRFLGQVKEVYFEQSPLAGRLEGRTENYLRVTVESSAPPTEIALVRLVNYEDQRIVGEPAWKSATAEKVAF